MGDQSHHKNGKSLNKMANDAFLSVEWSAYYVDLYRLQVTTGVVIEILPWFMLTLSTTIQHRNSDSTSSNLNTSSGAQLIN